MSARAATPPWHSAVLLRIPAGPALRTLLQVITVHERSDLLRPAAGHRDLPRPQPGRFLVGYVNDAEAAEVLLGLGERAVGEQRRAARRIDAEHRAILDVDAAGEDEDPGRLHL